jgi:AraC-like DNA-binding protein
LAAALGVANDVVETRNAKSAFGLLAASGHYFDVVIVTCLARRERPLHRASVGLVRAMYQRWPWIPVVMIGRSQEAALLGGEVLLGSVRGFLRKPFAAVDLRRAINRIVRRRAARVPPSPRTLGTMKRVLGVLGEHVGEALPLGELAGMAAMSRSHFSHMFHAVVGMSLRDYVRDLRLKQAHHFLVDSRLSLTTIAVDAGFYDLPHFDKAFRHRIGLSPQEFRRRYAGLATP